MTGQIKTATPPSDREAGFTLIEIIVVVAIIIILVSILLPALGAAKTKGYSVKTTAQMQAISNGCDQYYITFQAYPGALSDATVAANNNNVTGTQNMTVSLFGTLEPAANTTTNTVTLATGTTPDTSLPFSLYADMTINSGPIDYSNSSRQYQAFYTAKATEYTNSQTMPLTAGTATNVYVLVDSYPDALPILYYRRTSGIDGTATTAAAETQNLSSGKAAYYWGANSLFIATNSAFKSPSGSVTTQNGALAADLAFGIVATGNAAYTAGSHTYPAQGGFMLISAGADRNYGLAAGKISSDDIVRFGGQ